MIPPGRMNGGAGGAGLGRLVVTPERADVDVRRGVTPNGDPVVWVAISPAGWPLTLTVPVPVLAWAKMVSSVTPADATG